MTWPLDAVYQRAKQARQGTLAPDPRFEPFLGEFAKRFRVRPLWLETDHIPWRGDRLHVRPRLNVVIERSVDYRSFRSRGGNFHSGRQRSTAALFVKHLPAEDLPALFGLPPAEQGDLDWGWEIFVCYSDFESAAILDIHRSVTDEQLLSLESSLGLGDDLWCLRRVPGPPVVFVHTAAQAAGWAASPEPARWSKTYLRLAQTHDEFGYLRREDITLQVDSKENFDTNYASNWWYYLK